jgi:hypothetical protein
MMLRITLVTVTERPITGESTKETVKTIRAGNAGMFGEPVVTNLRVFYSYTQGCGCAQASGIPCALCFSREVICNSSGAFASREGEGVSGVAISTQAGSSCPDLIRASIEFHESIYRRRLDGRVKPGHDEGKTRCPQPFL